MLILFVLGNNFTQKQQPSVSLIIQAADFVSFNKFAFLQACQHQFVASHLSESKDES